MTMIMVVIRENKETVKTAFRDVQSTTEILIFLSMRLKENIYRLYKYTVQNDAKVLNPSAFLMYKMDVLQNFQEI